MGRRFWAAWKRCRWPAESAAAAVRTPSASTASRSITSRPMSSPWKDILMFTGIIEELGTVASIQGGRLTVRCSTVRQDLAEGASIAVNGVCLTAVDLRHDAFSADLA